MPVSPEASSLGKYGEWPVSYYTGTTNVSVPIYQIKTGGFELPIQLSYHMGGIKVDEVPSWTGTGWTLNAGGVITRSIIGIADEEYHGFLSRNLRNLPLKGNYLLGNIDDYLTLRQVATQQLDTEPDMFFYNFAGLSGRFYFDNTGKFQAIPVNSLKLISSPIRNPENNLWQIADQQGNIFYFGSPGVDDQANGLEHTITDNKFLDGVNQLIVNPISAWYLTKIFVKNNADTIRFDYDAKAEKYVMPPVFSYKKITNGYALGNLNLLISNYQDVLGVGRVLRNGQNDNGTYNPSKTMVAGHSVLRKISWSQGQIQFEAGIDRLDILGKNLTKITLFNKQLEKIQETKFAYSYHAARYYLDSLIEYGAGINKKLSHSFEYESPYALAERNSSRQDHWGYYNAASNTHLLPSHMQISEPGLDANREPNETAMVYGTLKKIKYPTGGTTEFSFEANRYDPKDVPGGGAPVQEIVNSAVTVSAYDPQSGSAFPREITFNVPMAQQKASIELNFRDYGKPPTKGAGILPIVTLQMLKNGSYQTIMSWDAYDRFPLNPTPKPNHHFDYDVTISNLTLEAGNYRIVADLEPEKFGLGDPPPVMPSIRGTFKFTTYAWVTPTIASSPMAGGLRIKEVVNKVNNVEVDRKRYSYNVGNILIYPQYIHSYSEDIFPRADCHKTPGGCGTLCFTLIADYQEIISSGQAILGFTQGSPVGYTNVEERSIGPSGEENGYTAYTFSFKNDDLNELNFDSYWTDLTVLNRIAPLNNNEYKRGLLLEKNVFKRGADGTAIKISHLRNVYEFNDGNINKRFNTLRGMRVKRMRFINYPCGNEIYIGGMVPASGFSPDFAYSFYDVFTGWVQQISTRETTFDLNGLNPIEKRTDFNFDNPSHLQVTSSTTKLSDEKLHEQQFLYPSDMVNSGRDVTGIYAEMEANNIISPIIEQVNKKGGLIAAVQRTNYYKPYPGVYVPRSVEERNLLTGLDEIRLRYLDYDATGNLLSLSQENGINVSYLWSYNGQYPVAEIKGSDYSTIENLLGGKSSINTFRNSNPNQQALSGFIASLKTALPNVQISTAVYKPFIGISTMTDVKGQTVYYEYDSTNRLMNVKDQYGNIIKNYIYHYSTQ